MISDFRVRISDCRRPRRRGGFSFVEVLFAVMILGIGFIMLAGIFPVALSQSQATADETVGAAVARGAAEYLATLPYSSQLMRFPQPNTATDPIPPSDQLFHPMWDVGFNVVIDSAGNTLNTSLWQQVRGNLILPEDPRYAWVAFWRRPNDGSGKPGNYAQIVVVAVRVRARTEYTTQADLVDGSGTPAVPTLMGRTITVNKLIESDEGDVIVLDNGGNAAACAAPYSYVLIAGGNDSGSPARPAGGRIYRLGNEIPTGSASERTFELLPGNDMTLLPGPNGTFGNSDDIKEDATNLPALIIGLGTDAGGNFSDSAQDIAVYSSFIRLN